MLGPRLGGSSGGTGSEPSDSLNDSDVGDGGKGTWWGSGGSSKDGTGLRFCGVKLLRWEATDLLDGVKSGCVGTLSEGRMRS